ncbi:MAG: ABC transporter substrate-binding protein [Bacteroidia bacterium]
MYVILSLVMSMGLFSCGGESEKGDFGENGCYRGTKTDAIVTQLMGEPKSLGLNEPTAGQYADISNYIHAWVYTNDDNGDLRPVLASGKPEVSADGLQYTVTLRAEAKWEDGKDVTAEDVLFSIKVALCPLKVKDGIMGFLEVLKDVQVSKDNPKQLTVTMKSYNVWNDYFFANFPIIDKRVYDSENRLEKYGIAELMDSKKDWKKEEGMVAFAKNLEDAKYGHDPKFVKGLGPYQLEKWEAGKEIVLAKKENFWGKSLEGYIFGQSSSKIIYRLVNDPAAVEAAFKQGQIDVSERITADVFTKLSQDSALKKEYEFAVAPRSLFAQITFNTKPDGVKHKKIFNDLLVRKAFAYLTPTDEIIKENMKGFGTRVAVPIPIDAADYNKALSLIPLNVAKGDSLLKAAGWADTDGDKILDKLIDGKKQPLELSMTMAKLYEPHAKRIASAYEKSGIKLNLDILPSGGAVDKLGARDFDMLIWASGGDASLPTDYKQLWHSKNWADKAGQNFSGFGSPQSDKLIEELRITKDKAKRIEISKQIQQLIYDYQPAIFMWQSQGRMVYHKRFRGVYLPKERPYIWLNTAKITKC